MDIERPELLPDIRSLPLQSHTLFYLATESQVEIIQSYMAAKILNAV
jgi:toxin ParE1/3/4